MAKILLGATLGDARGSVGGVTYTKGRFGPVLRQKVSPVQPRSARVLNTRGLFALLAKRWAVTLTDAQRLGWIALAAANPRTNVFGNSVILTGLQMYESCNRNLQRCLLAPIDDAPPNMDVDALSTITFTPDKTGATFEVAHTPTPIPALHYLVMEATLQVNPGRAFVSSYYRYIALRIPTDPSPASIYVSYSLVWGSLRLGQRITGRAFFIKSTNGAASTPLVDTAIVV